MGAQVGGGLELIFLNQVPRFRIGTCLGGALELLLEHLQWFAICTCYPCLFGKNYKFDSPMVC